MKKFVTNDSWTGPDKKKHFAAGVLAGVIGTLAAKDPLVGVALTVVVALGKEVYDAFGDGTPSLQDLVVTIAGGVASSLALFLGTK